MAEEKEYDLIIPPGTPNMETLLSEVLDKFDLKLIAPKDLDAPYYLALRGKLEEVEAAKEYMKARVEAMVAEMEKKLENSH